MGLPFIGVHKRPRTPGPFPFQNKDFSIKARAQILKALPIAPKIYTGCRSEIVRIQHDVVVKYGSGVGVHEAEIMQYLTEYSPLRVPKVYDYWDEEHDGEPGDGRRRDPDLEIHSFLDGYKTGYIVMSFIEGETLDELLTRAGPVDVDFLSQVNKQLAAFIRELQDDQSDQPGLLNNRPYNDRFWTDDGEGPYEAAEYFTLFHEDILRRRNRVSPVARQAALRCDKLVCCHLDLRPANIMIDKQNQLWVINWDIAGFYPAYFEFAAILKWDKAGRLHECFDMLVDEATREDIKGLVPDWWDLAIKTFSCTPELFRDRDT